MWFNQFNYIKWLFILKKGGGKKRWGGKKKKKTRGGKKCRLRSHALAGLLLETAFSCLTCFGCYYPIYVIQLYKNDFLSYLKKGGGGMKKRREKKKKRRGEKEGKKRGRGGEKRGGRKKKRGIAHARAFTYVQVGPWLERVSFCCYRIINLHLYYFKNNMFLKRGRGFYEIQYTHWQKCIFRLNQKCVGNCAFFSNSKWLALLGFRHCQSLLGTLELAQY